MPGPEDNPKWEEAERRIAEVIKSGSTALDLTSLGLDSLPDSIAELPEMLNLDLGSNRFTEIPEVIGRIRVLRAVRFTDNQIETIPDFIAAMPTLELLNLASNRVKAIPESLSTMANLKTLGLSANRIKQIPVSLARLKTLKTIYLSPNPLPDEVLVAASRGVESLFRHLEATAIRKVYPRTVKMVFLGEPKSGKTTLLEALKGNLHPCDPARKETLGVDVVSIEKPHPTDHQPMYLSAWDFAGQHMEHATHQFFLTDNAIYLILWNARLGADAGKHDLWYWLDLLKMRVREPKYVLVATHTKFTPADLNLSEIDANYPGRQGQFSVDLEDLAGFDLLHQQILQLAADSPSLHAEWPPEWLTIRDAVREVRKRQPHMTPVTFLDLMAKYAVTEPLQQKDLIHQLHDLGEILYFEERDELSSLVILDPDWVTELIALVVRSKEVRERKGMLSKTDLDTLWAGARLTSELRSHLISLMDWFDLTYSTGDRSDIGIVVEALPYSSPEDRKGIELVPGRPQMEMIFRFSSNQRHLPPGIPTWGIARAHRFKQCTPWRDAAAFMDGDTNSQALILASDTTKEIRLRVTADYPPFFFGMLQAILLDTFKRYRGTAPERRLPCPCQPDCPQSYLYDTVVKRAKAGKGEVTCDISAEDVPISSLLTGYRPETEAGLLALRSEIRRQHTERLRADRERMEKTCPSVFTLVPAQGFKQLDTWIEYATKDAELELALYCEHESDWHPTSHSLYRFRPDQQRFESLKKNWNQFARATKKAASLAKTVGKAAGFAWKETAEVVNMVTEALPEADIEASGRLSSALGGKAVPEAVDLETRFLLQALIADLDSKRDITDTRNGGLHPYIVDDGRLLWLCPDHIKTYKTRVN